MARILPGSLIPVVLLIGACTGGALPPATPSDSPQTPRPTASPTPKPTPVVLTPIEQAVDGVDGRSVKLGSDAYALDLTYAFDSIWVANHHQDDVYRIDPDSLELEAQIPVGRGPGWLTATEDAVWVSNQNGFGVSRIDPATNTAITAIGSKPPCEDLAVAGGYVWQWACDWDSLVRIDPATNETEVFPAAGHGYLAAATGRLYASVGNGVDVVDPQSVGFNSFSECECDRFLGMDDEAMWFDSSTSSTVSRVSVVDGTVLGTLELPDATTVVGSGGHAWVSLSNGRVQEIDVASGELGRSLRMRRPFALVERDGVLWVVDQSKETLWRLEP